MKKLLILLLCSNVALANNVQPVQKGQPSPYDGIIFDVEAGNDLRKKDLDYSFAIKQTDQLSKENGLLGQRLDLANKEIERLDKKDSKFLGLDGGFIGGVVLTVLLTFAVKKATQ